MTAKIVQISKFLPKPTSEEDPDDILSPEEIERLNKEKEEKLLEDRRQHNLRVTKTFKLKPKKK